MGFYETRAGAPDYKHFQIRGVCDMQPHFHSSVELIFVKDGVLSATVNGERRVLTRGDACYIDAFDVHSYSDGNNCAAYVLVFDKKYENVFLSESNGKSFSTFFKFNDYALLETLYNLEKQNFTEMGFTGVVNSLYAAMLQSVDVVSKSHNAPSDLICRILAYTESNLNKKITLEILGDIFGYNAQYVSRVINKYLPNGFKDYLNGLRVEKVRDELMRTDATVLDVAFKWGFESASSFYRAYQKRFGTSPREKVDF